MKQSDMRAWALRGAEQRLIDIGEEAKAIFRAFPELRGRGRGFDAAPAAAVPEGQPQRRRRRRKISAAQRKAVSRRMKKYWADRRKAKAQK